MSEAGPSRRGLRILVVEDDYLIAAEIALTLEDMGHQVVGPTPTIAAASALIASEELDCVLLDANLGGVSSAPIAAECIARALPFIVVTGYGGFKLDAADLDAAPRVRKPFSAHDLAATLDQALVMS